MRRQKRRLVYPGKEEGEEYSKRGGRPVVIKDRIEIDTSLFRSTDNSKIKLEMYSGEWHCSHDYDGWAGGTHAWGSFSGGGHGTTEGVLAYLKKEKERIPKYIKSLVKDLGIIDGNLEKAIRRIEGCPQKYKSL